MPAYALRPVTADDAELLLRVYASTREEELALVPWTPEQKTQFLRMQFTAQDTDYRRNYAAAEFLVIEAEGRPAGRLYLLKGGDTFHIIDISLLPEFRGAGIGRALFEAVMADAAAAGKPVTIHVEKMNRARTLYERLGFRVVEDKGVYLLMRWSPEAVR